MPRYDMTNFSDEDFNLTPSIPMGTKIMAISKKLGSPIEYSTHRTAQTRDQHFLYVTGTTTYEIKNEDSYHIVLCYICDIDPDRCSGDYFTRSDFILVDEMENADLLPFLKETSD